MYSVLSAGRLKKIMFPSERDFWVFMERMRGTPHQMFGYERQSSGVCTAFFLTEAPRGSASFVGDEGIFSFRKLECDGEVSG